jgi:hypothetical protein
MRIIATACIALLVTPALAGDYPGEMKVNFRTMDCDGAGGFASVKADQLSRIQPYVCPNGLRLKQVLTKDPSGTNEVYLVNDAQALELEAELKRVEDARRKALEHTTPLIIEHQ